MTAEGAWFDLDLPSGKDAPSWKRSQIVSASLRKVPFPHFSIDDLIPPKTFDSLARSVAAQVFAYHMQSDEDERGMMYCPLMVRAAVEFFCGPMFKSLLAMVVGRSVARPKNSVPQLRVNIGPTPALAIHTDAHAAFDLATFFFVHETWDSNAGGKLRVYEEDSVGQMKLTYELDPNPNRLIGMMFSPISYHSVSPIEGTGSRIAIYQEWIFCS